MSEISDFDGQLMHMARKKATLKQLKKRGLAHQDQGEVYATHLPRPILVITRCVHLSPEGRRCHMPAEEEWQLGSYIMQTCKVHGWKAHADGTATPLFYDGIPSDQDMERVKK